MITLATIIHIIVSIVIIIAVLLQVGKGATIGSAFGGSSNQTIFGSAGPATFLAKITAGAAVIFMLTSMYLTFTSGKAKSSSVMSSMPAATQSKPTEATTPQAQPLQAPASKPLPAAPATQPAATPKK